VCLLALTLSGCFGTLLQVKPPENLMTKCPKALPMLTDGTGKDVILTMRDWASQYHECKTRHNGLVDAINEVSE
jgi:hypothetical protein